MPEIGFFTYVINNTLYLIFHLNIVFFVFNLIPIYPLDGFRILDVFINKKSAIYNFLRYKGIYVLYAFIGLSILADFTGFQQLNILGYAINELSWYVSLPIRLFWGLIF